MRQAFLTLLLVAAQLVSWNANPLFLCIGEDGSMDLHLGPVPCDCRPDDAAARGRVSARPVSPERCCPEQSCRDCAWPARARAIPAAPRERLQLAECVDASCDCTHILITVPWIAARVTHVVTGASPPQLAPTIGHDGAGATAAGACMASAASVATLAARCPSLDGATVVLRC